jgi:hypothetical protein
LLNSLKRSKLPSLTANRIDHGREVCESKADYAKQQLTSKMDDRVKKEEHIKKAIQLLERKLLTVEKK